MDDLLPRPDHHTPSWMLNARCRDAAPGAFFPSDGVGVDRARQVCAECAVQAECLEYALEFRIDHGVWGGCSERERRRILRQRRLTASR
jgi:WhiB family redox-sensing transcriptional regulator